MLALYFGFSSILSFNHQLNPDGVLCLKTLLRYRNFIMLEILFFGKGIFEKDFIILKNKTNLNLRRHAVAKRHPVALSNYTINKRCVGCFSNPLPQRNEREQR
ncbi:MAG: hypothetical protein L3J15_08935 [Devosiaceae bacterium]|nr:hypothetical protein [Devosiaceae bacterium]